MYNKLPVKERIELMKSYRKANKDMSYRDMVKDYNDSYEKFRDGGKKKDPPIDFEGSRRTSSNSFPTSKIEAEEMLAEQRKPGYKKEDNLEYYREKAYRNKDQGTVKEYIPQSKISKTLEIAANPLPAMKNYIATGRVPDHFSQDAEESMLSPTGVANMAYQGLTGVGKLAGITNAGYNVPVDLAEGNYLSAGMNALDVLPGINNNIKNLKKINNKIIPKNAKPQDGADFMKQWYGSPEFKERYRSTGSFHPEGMQQHMLNRLSEYEPKNYINLLKDKGLKDYMNFTLTSGGVSYGEPKSIYLNKTAHPFNKKGLESTRTHELTHLLEDNGSRLSEKDEQALLKPFGFSNTNEIPKEKGFFQKNILDNDPKYYLEPTEIHSRMNQARYDLGLSPKDTFTEEMFDKVSKKYNWYGMKRYIKDKKSFLDLMNKFWVAPAVATGLTATQQKTDK